LGWDGAGGFPLELEAAAHLDVVGIGDAIDRHQLAHPDAIAIGDFREALPGAHQMLAGTAAVAGG
jgi:hypothetical protein